MSIYLRKKKTNHQDTSVCLLSSYVVSVVFFQRQILDTLCINLSTGMCTIQNTQWACKSHPRKKIFYVDSCLFIIMFFQRRSYQIHLAYPVQGLAMSLHAEGGVVCIKTIAVPKSAIHKVQFSIFFDLAIWDFFSFLLCPAWCGGGPIHDWWLMSVRISVPSS